MGFKGNWRFYCLLEYKSELYNKRIDFETEKPVQYNRIVMADVLTRIMRQAKFIYDFSSVSGKKTTIWTQNKLHLAYRDHTNTP